MTLNAVNRRAQRRALEQQEAEAYEQSTQSAGTAEGGDDPLIAKLKELASLHQSGALTDDEFARAKARLLA